MFYARIAEWVRLTYVFNLILLTNAAVLSPGLCIEPFLAHNPFQEQALEMKRVLYRVMSRTYTSTTKVTLFLFIFLFWLCTEHATGTPPVAVPTSLLGMQHNPCLWGGQAVGFCRVPHCADLAAINHAWVALATPSTILLNQLY